MKIDRVVLRRGRALSTSRRRTYTLWVMGLLVIAVAAAGVGAVFAPEAQAASSFTFVGRGNGHGVGMSQWGAWQAAREGNTYDQILAFYYPNTVLQKVDDVYGPSEQTIKVRDKHDNQTESTASTRSSRCAWSRA